MNNTKTKIFIADDHQIVIDAVQNQIQIQSDQFEFVGSALNGKIALEAFKTTSVDILILDISMPEMDGTELLKEIAITYPNIKVLVLTMNDDLKHIREMLKLGAKGYILKNKSTQYVIKALVDIRDGKEFIPNDVAQIAVRDFIPNDDFKERSNKEAILKSIKDHEAELLGLLTIELSAKQIADRMCKSESAIESRKKNLMQKVGAKNVVGLVRFAIENGFSKKKE